MIETLIVPVRRVWFETLDERALVDAVDGRRPALSTGLVQIHTIRLQKAIASAQRPQKVCVTVAQHVAQ